MSRRVDALTRDNSEFFHVSKEWCLAINNIDYIRQSLPSFIKVNPKWFNIYNKITENIFYL